MTDDIQVYHDLDGKEIIHERWAWEVFYTDGSAFKQFDDAGIFHRFNEIDQSRIMTFRMTNGERFIDIQWNPSYKLIHFYRHRWLNFGTNEEVRLQYYCFGYQDGPHKLITMILPDDSMVMTDDVDRINLDG